MNKLKVCATFLLFLGLSLVSITSILAPISALQANESAVPSNSTLSQSPSVSSSVRLIMFERLGCEYCDLWNEEIGETYAKTREGQFAPLKRVFQGDASVKSIKRIIYTPTFVIMKGDREVGRILGYSGEDFFWLFLKENLVKAGFKPLS